MYTTSHTRVKLNGRLAEIISLLALGFARTRRPDFISWWDSLMSRTPAMDGCHELCLLHLSDLNSIRYALIELTGGQQTLVSNDLTSQCLGLIVTLKQCHHLIDHWDEPHDRTFWHHSARWPSTIDHPSRRSGPHASLPCLSSITIMFTCLLTSPRCSWLTGLVIAEPFI